MSSPSVGAQIQNNFTFFEKYGGSWRSHSRAGISRLRTATLSALHLGGEQGSPAPLTRAHRPRLHSVCVCVCVCVCVLLHVWDFPSISWEMVSLRCVTSSRPVRMIKSCRRRRGRDIFSCEDEVCSLEVLGSVGNQAICFIDLMHRGRKCSYKYHNTVITLFTWHILINTKCFRIKKNTKHIKHKRSKTEFHNANKSVFVY